MWKTCRALAATYGTRCWCLEPCARHFLTFMAQHKAGTYSAALYMLCMCWLCVLPVGVASVQPTELAALLCRSQPGYQLPTAAPRRELQYALDDAQVAVVLTTREHEAALAPLARQAGADLRLLQPQACAPRSADSPPRVTRLPAVRVAEPAKCAAHQSVPLAMA